MSGSREKNQSDFDLGRFIDMFDQAMVSEDPRVVDALRSLMMMVILTKPEVAASPLVDRQRGPLRRMYEDLGDLNRRMTRLEEETRESKHDTRTYSFANQWDELDRYPNEKYAARQLSASIDQQIINNITQALTSKKTDI